ncbi:MAG TPA: aminotransferase class I/II-fold pyridoxal phosphate-dependent enzyme, partial [bacterium]|nr:aminotransferase class I/II-fold pyridoxal phosphate-dependent enzyme [bacterium]
YRLTYVTRYKAVFKHFPLFNEKNCFNTAGFEEVVKETKKTKNKVIVLLNFPNNPIGYSPTKTEAAQIADILLKYASPEYNIITVLDDAYFGLFFDDAVYTNSMFSKLAGKSENLLAIKLDAATKEDYVWGFRCGFITYSIKCGNCEELNDALEKKTGGCIRGNISNCSNIAQSVMTRLLQDKGVYLKEKEEKFTLLKNRAEKVKKVLSNPKYSERWTMYPFNSGYFMCVKLRGINSEAYRKFLLHQYGVGVISPNDTDIRIAFSAVDEKDIEELFDVMSQAASEFSKKAK